MRYGFLFLDYFWWHYTRGLVDLLVNLKNLVRFVYNYFSLSVLLKTLFAPWRRLGEAYPSKFSPSAFFQALVINTLMRIFGFCVRLVILLIGIFFYLLSLMGAVLFFAAWLVIPVIVAYCLFLSVYLIFS